MSTEIMMAVHKETIENDHDSLVSETFKVIDGKGGVQELVHGCMGLTGEVGELIDAIKKHVYYGKPLDVRNVIEELGDVEYYLKAIRQNLLLDRTSILAANIEKLDKRYPGRVFTNTAAQARADKMAESMSRTPKFKPHSVEQAEFTERRLSDRMNSERGTL